MYRLDAHTHSIASGHGGSDTITDMARAAAARGIEVLALTEHGPGMPGACGESYFRSLRLAPAFRYGVKLLYGAEADILSSVGELDLGEDILVGLFPVIASLHKPCYGGSRSIGENTRACVRAMENPHVHILGHPDDTFYELDYEELVPAARDNHVALELNNASLSPAGYRGDTRDNDRRMLSLCRRWGCPVVVSSDSHGAGGIGDFVWAEQLLREEGFPEELVLNCRPEEFHGPVIF